ncbi:hypothetical protein [uncultured Psychrobacter sp.]|uniref:hypothetical protein n=1 Tax=uncultured Psychrobacter sp. TaxID=259303 RepID=UPI003458D175
MNKERCVVLTSTVLAISLLSSGCQALKGYNQIDIAKKSEAWAGEVSPIADEVNITCVGTYHCEITQIDQTQVIDLEHMPADPAMLSFISNTDIDIDDGTIEPLKNKQSVKVVPLSASGMPDMINYYARVKPAKREVHVNFYPENNVGYVERFAIIHEFMEPGIYQLRAYRKKPTQDPASLLETASPNPLCIDLLQGSDIKRRFCKQISTESQGEFVEISLADQLDPTAS